MKIVQILNNIWIGQPINKHELAADPEFVRMLFNFDEKVKLCDLSYITCLNGKYDYNFDSNNLCREFFHVVYLPDIEYKDAFSRAYKGVFEFILDVRVFRSPVVCWQPNVKSF